MPTLDPDYMPQGGSNYTKMLEAALEGFGEKTDRDRYLIVLSDGESSTQGWQNRLGDLAKRDVHVVGIGIGTDKGGFINDQKGGYMADKNGDAVLSKLNPATLQTLANRTNGKYPQCERAQERGRRALPREGNGRDRPPGTCQQRGHQPAVGTVPMVSAAPRYCWG